MNPNQLMSVIDLSGNLGYRYRRLLGITKVITISASTANYTWTDMPLAETFLAGSSRNLVKVDLTGMKEIRIGARVSTQGSASAILYVKYALTDVVSVASFSSIATSGNASVSIAATGTPTGAWTPIATAAKTDVWLCVAGSGGDGSADPVFGNIFIEAR